MSICNERENALVNNNRRWSADRRFEENEVEKKHRELCLFDIASWKYKRNNGAKPRERDPILE